MKKYMLLAIFVAISVTSYALSASKSVTGVVYEINSENEKVPIIGVNISWLGSTIGVISDENGEFSIPFINEKDAILIFSYVGYGKVELSSIEDGANLDVILKRGEVLDDVNVVVRRKATQFSTLSAMQTQKLTTAELARCACCNLSESFETNAAVDVAYSDAVSGVKAIKMLGLSGRYSQMMMENIPMMRGSETSFGLEYVPGTWMNAIQVSKGTAAVKNGFESTTGQINLELKDPSSEEKLNLYAYGNQDGKLEGNLFYSAKLNDKWGAAILMHGETTVREMDSNDDLFLDKPNIDQGNFMARFEYSSDYLTWKVGASFLSESRKGGQLSYDHDQSFSDQDDYGIGIDSEKIFIYSKLGRVFDKERTSIGWITNYNNFQRESFYGVRTYNSNQQNFYTNLIFQSYIGSEKHLYNTGVSYQYDNNDDYLNSDGGNSDTDRYVGHKESVGGLFFEYSYIPNEDVTLLGGLRYDNSSLYGGFWTPRVHLRYRVAPSTTLRASAGKGYRTANAVAENSNYLASSREFIFSEEEIAQEEAWNYGVSVSNTLPIAGRDLIVVADFYRTDFENQLIVDLLESSRSVSFSNLDGSSYSNSLQLEANYELFNRFTLTGAYRLNDVKSTYRGELQKVPMVAKHKGMISGSYSTNLNKWQFDLTAQFNGVKPMAYSDDIPAEYSSSVSESEKYTVLMGQVTKNYKGWSFYLGGENLASFIQENPIISVDDPFGDNFDASQVWGPIYGRMFYLGVKFSIDK